MTGPLRKRLDAARLYIVLDRDVRDYEALFEILRETVRAGAGMIQLRDKNGSTRDILDACDRILGIIRGQVPFIVNDRIDIALAVRADGVHLGQADMPLRRARALVGQEMLIGISCQTLEQALEAQADGADYIGFGSVFHTQTKPERRPMDLKVWHSLNHQIKIPVFAIGGITSENLPRLTPYGIKRVAVTRAVCLANAIDRATRELIDALDVSRNNEGQESGRGGVFKR